MKVIYLDYTLEGIMRERMQKSITGFADYGRYTAKLNNDKKTFTVWAHVNDVARKIGSAPLVVKAR
jgi:hypothetical protein